jgi:hypothetical protein
VDPVPDSLLLRKNLVAQGIEAGPLAGTLISPVQNLEDKLIAQCMSRMYIEEDDS